MEVLICTGESRQLRCVGWERPEKTCLFRALFPKMHVPNCRSDPSQSSWPTSGFSWAPLMTWSAVTSLKKKTHCFWLHHMVCGTLVPWHGIEPASLALEAWSLNHWTTREVPIVTSDFSCCGEGQWRRLLERDKKFGLTLNGISLGGRVFRFLSICRFV